MICSVLTACPEASLAWIWAEIRRLAPWFSKHAATLGRRGSAPSHLFDSRPLWLFRLFLACPGFTSDPAPVVPLTRSAQIAVRRIIAVIKRFNGSIQFFRQITLDLTGITALNIPAPIN